MNWLEFVENMSLVEKVLQTDPASIYSKMDFATRDHYRHVIENIARYSNCSEVAVAQNAIRFAANAPSEAHHKISSESVQGSSDTETIPRQSDHRKAHVGYF